MAGALRAGVVASIFAAVLGACAYYGRFGLHLQQAYLEAQRPTAPTPDPATTTFTPDPWCPQCRGALCQHKFLFVIATGRSGSTTLMDMVNLIDGFFIYGENWHMLRDLGISLADFLARTAFRAQVGPALTERLLMNFQGLLWEFLAPPRFEGRWKQASVRGFKEIRWDNSSIMFLKHACPCSRIIFNYRLDLEAQSKSGFWIRTNMSVDGLLDWNARYRQLAAESGFPFYEMNLENYSVQSFNKLSRWLGAACEFDQLIHSTAHRVSGPLVVPKCASLLGERQPWCTNCDDDALCTHKFLFTELDPNNSQFQHLTTSSRIFFSSGSSEMLAHNFLLAVRYMQKPGRSPPEPTSASDIAQMTAWAHPPQAVRRKSLLQAHQLIWDWLQPPWPEHSNVRAYNLQSLNTTNIEWMLNLCPCSRFALNVHGEFQKTERQMLIKMLRSSGLQYTDLADGELTDWLQQERAL
ncbi:unnamed protein product [Symbiodinium sp. CCMP2592]|nr:unnamed protein product [Symbiodinium sp. CCMP2592]